MSDRGRERAEGGRVGGGGAWNMAAMETASIQQFVPHNIPLDEREDNYASDTEFSDYWGGQCE